MKAIKNIKYFGLGLILTSLVIPACDITEEPYDGVDENLVFSTAEGIEKAVLGVYGYFHYQDPSGTFGAYDYYLRLQHFVGEYAADNIVVSGTTSDPLFNIYGYNHNLDNGSVKAFYQSSYKMIIGLNNIIANLSISGPSDPRAHMLGECYFLRGYIYFNLVNTFGRPYQQSPESNLGVSIKMDVDENNVPPRSTVQEVYDAIESDYLKAVSLMKMRNDALPEKWKNIRGCKEAGWAALSRFYLYKDDNTKAEAYADSVISCKTYSLINDSSAYTKYQRIVPEDPNQTETIFAIKQTEDDKLGWAAVGAMYFKFEGNGWGETYAAEPFRKLLGQNPRDWRHGFIEGQYKNGKIDKRNGIDKYFINKCSFQEDQLLVYSPVIFRLAEMYLNRAEARAKTGDWSGAIEDVNVIRERVKIPEWKVEDFTTQSQVLDSVLQERRVELAFEAHRKFDLFRNNKPMIRTYKGAHDKLGNDTINPDHPRVVLYLPEVEILAQPNLVQNP